jgi:hypothetical protein
MADSAGNCGSVHRSRTSLSVCITHVATGKKAINAVRWWVITLFLILATAKILHEIHLLTPIWQELIGPNYREHLDPGSILNFRRCLIKLQDLGDQLKREYSWLHTKISELRMKCKLVYRDREKWHVYHLHLSGSSVHVKAPMKTIE